MAPHVKRSFPFVLQNLSISGISKITRPYHHIELLLVRIYEPQANSALLYSLHCHILKSYHIPKFQLYNSILYGGPERTWCKYIFVAPDRFPSGDVCLSGCRYDVLAGNHGVCRILGRADARSTCSGSSTLVLSRGRRGMCG